MDPERWHHLSDLFHKALEHEPEHRISFLDEACGDDASLRAEVASLLAYHEQADDLIDTPTHLVGGAAREPAPPEPSLVGNTLHQYVVTEKLGEGGMGVVYLADDTRLGRPVAIKALARQFTQDVHRRERLRREARAAAALSHPGIATVYALEEFDSNLYIVSEYVPGKTLRDEVAQGPLALGPLLNTGVEIVRALAAAHQQGVIHRDLKPENVIRTPEGGLKVLDFGLARVRSPEGGTSFSGTRLTEPGAVLGTPGYMPPEQLRGAEVDFRVDIFSFGVLLYELASGVHPFTSSNAASTIARVLEADPPDVAQLNAACHAALEQLIRRCLQKEPDLRYGSTRELVEALEELRRDFVGAQTPRSSTQTPARATAARRRPGSSPLWWWQFHQAVVGLLYYLTLIPLWFVRGWTTAPWGSLLFFSSVATVSVAATLRFNLWFTSRFNPTELAAQRDHVFRWIRGADWLFVLLLLAAAMFVANDRAAVATLLVAVSVGSFLAFMIIEPVTTRTAFKRRRSSSRSRTGRRKSNAGRSKKADS